MEIREQAAFSLWALGGQIKTQQRSVAQCFGIPQIVTMLLSNSEKLQFISLNAIIALSDEDESNQNKLYKENILPPLFRLLKLYKQLTHRVLLVLVKAFGILCIGMFNKTIFTKTCFILFVKGISLVPNTLLQNAIVEQNGIDLLIRLMETTEYIDVKVKKKENEKNLFV